MAYQPQPQGPYLKGIVASNSPLAQPKNAVARASNLVLTTRGALSVCDGTAILNWFNSAIQGSAGRFSSVLLFAPIGVPSYYLLTGSVKVPLGPIAMLTAMATTGTGALAPATYYYRVTAIDGIGGETNSTVEASATLSLTGEITLTWNTVSNAFGYNVYRSTVSGNEILLVSTGNLPVLQPNPLSNTVSFVDTGYAISAQINISNIVGSDAGSIATISFNVPTGVVIPRGVTVAIFGITPSTFDTVVDSINFQSGSLVQIYGGPGSGTGTGGYIIIGSSSTPTPPVTDTTSQTALFQMPLGTIPVAYNYENIVAYFPASLAGFGTVPSGGTGGGGGTGSGISGQSASTPSGGVKGLTNQIPQMLQFTNRVVLALGNGFAPQLYSDASGTTVNPALIGAISAVSVSGDQVTLTTSAPLTATNFPPGSNVLLRMFDATYSGFFVVLSVNTGAGTFVVRNPAASGGATTGSFTATTIPIVNTFVPSYPTWTASTTYYLNSVVIPITSPVSYFIALNDGESGGTEPTWANASNVGDQISDGTIIWKNGGLINSSAPAPPGAGHALVYAGELWFLDTSPIDESSGIDGPCALRASNVNDPTAWNPVNAAFLDKDDGTEGMGLASFTITAEGIPPEGSLVAFKQYATYQITGVFGSTNFSIQRVKTDMGCMAPRSAQFIPGFGVGRMTHLGNAVFDGVNDRLISEPIRPYLFPLNDETTSDITVMDANWTAASYGFQTANPPMYCVAIPIGTSNGKLTRILGYDLVLKAWVIGDFPFSISCAVQARPVTSNPITVFGGTSDGVLQRWQAGDVLWYTGGGVSQSIPAWSFQTLTIASKDADQRLYCRRVVIRGQNTNLGVGATNILTVQALYGQNKQLSQKYAIPTSGDFDVFASIGLTDLRFAAIVSGNFHAEIDGNVFHVEPRPSGVPLVAI